MENQDIRVHSATCPGCGGQMKLNEARGMFECPYCGSIHSPEDLSRESDAVKAEKIRTQAYKDVENERLKWDKEKEKKQNEKAEIEAFKKGKLFKVLIVFSVISMLLCVIAFNDGRALAGIVGLLITAFFVCSILMGFKAIKEPFKGSRILSAVLGFVLILPYFNIYNSTAPKNTPVSTDSPSEYESVDVGNNEEAPKAIEDSGVVDANGGSSGLPSESSESEGEPVPSFSFVLEAGVAGEYGKMVTLNKGTEFEENFYAYFVPTGKYKVTNIGKHLDYITVYSDTTHITDAGWEEYEYVFDEKLLEVNESATITVGENQHIEIHEPSLLRLEKLDSQDEAEAADNSSASSESDEDKKENLSDGTIRPEFKEAVDGYEAFFDDYVAFMNKYKESNGTDLSLITDYASFMTKYADNLSKLDELEKDEDLTVAEAAYLAEVYARIMKKLAQVGQ